MLGLHFRDGETVTIRTSDGEIFIRVKTAECSSGAKLYFDAPRSIQIERGTAKNKTPKVRTGDGGH